MVVMFVGIFCLFLDLIPRKPSPIFSTIWLVVAKTTKFTGNSGNFFSNICFEEISNEPSLAIKFSQVVKKIDASLIFEVGCKLEFLNLSFKFLSKTKVSLSLQLFSSIMFCRF